MKLVFQEMKLTGGLKNFRFADNKPESIPKGTVTGFMKSADLIVAFDQGNLGRSTFDCRLQLALRNLDLFSHRPLRAYSSFQLFCYIR